MVSKVQAELDKGYTASVDMTTCSTTAINTPPLTAVSDDLWDHSPDHDTVPWPGNTYIIRDRIHGRLITLKEGKLQVEAVVGEPGGWHWVCVEKNGWLAFRNYVSGTYMGSGGNGKFCAKASLHQRNEFFCARRHPAGGYILLITYGNKLRKMDIGEDGNELVETDDEGTTWEFVRV